MGGCHDRTVEVIEVVLQYGQRLNVEIVGRLVQQQHVRRAHQHGEQIEPALFAAGKALDLRVLQIGVEQKALHHLRGRQGALVGFHAQGNIFDEVNGTHFAVHVGIILCEITDANGLPSGNRARIRLHTPGNHIQQRRLSAAVPPDNTHAIVTQQDIGKIVDQYALPEPFGDVIHFNDLASQPRGSRTNADLFLRPGRFDGRKLLKALNASLRFRGSGTRTALHPSQFYAQDRLALALTGKRHIFAFCLQFQIFRVIRRIGIELSLIQFDNLVGHALQKIAVVRHHDQRAGKGLQHFFQPGNHLAVQVIGRLVQNQQFAARPFSSARRKDDRPSVPYPQSPNASGSCAPHSFSVHAHLHRLRQRPLPAELPRDGIPDSAGGTRCAPCCPW